MPNDLSLPRRLVRHLQDIVPRGRGATVLAYHLVGAGTDSPVDVPVGIFEVQMRELREETQVRPLHEVAADLAAGRTPVEPTVVVTFDDAYENFYTHAYPILQAYEIPALLYVPVDFVERRAPPPISGTDGLPPCTWSQLREMQAGGLVTLGSHTLSHPSLPLVPHEQARLEIVRSREHLEDRLGAPVSSFCYPRALWTRALEEVVRDSYDTAVVAGGLKQDARTFDPHRIARISLRTDTPDRIAQLRAHHVWLEEWLADQVRRARFRLAA